MKAKKLTSSPYLIWIAIFTFVPLAMVVYFSFTSDFGGFTTQNFAEAAKYIPSLVQSIWLGMIATILCLIIGYPVAYIITKVSSSTQKTMVLLIMMPMWMNFLLRTYAWMTLLEDTGIINNLLSYIGLPRLRLINTDGAIVLGMIYNFLPFMIMPIYSVLTKMDKHLIEAAQDLGSNGFKVFQKIIIPLSIPGIISGINMVFVPAVSTFVISKMLGGGEMLIGDIIESQFFGSTYNPYLGAALSLILMVLVLICMAVMNQFGSDEEEQVII